MSKLREDRGAVAVEFALVFPILIAMLLGIVEFGFAYNTQVTVTNAAREGARTMAIQNDPSAARAAAQAVAPHLNPSMTDADIAIAPATCAPGLQSTMTITYTMPFLTGLFGADITLTGKAAMRCGG
jgi:Flp pilus assembly protein TadG